MSPTPADLPAVAKALRVAFGTGALDGWTPLSGGLSGAGVWRIRVGGIACLLKVEGQHQLTGVRGGRGGCALRRRNLVPTGPASPARGQAPTSSG
uniref:hypothetical protein n=1 Tax=uncultured Caulobacter sp. TaxID=158749 RepID=UPI0025DC5536|nr:hypothetical protein [uncultured Caulobacter sp.]